MSANDFIEACQLYDSWRQLRPLCAIERKGGLARMEAARALRLYLRIRRGL